MASVHVYRLRFWQKPINRPDIRFDVPQNTRGIDWEEVGEILDGEAPAKDYSPLRLVVRAKGATKWDTYYCDGTNGLLSKAAVDLIGPYMTAWFEFLEASINDEPYFFIRTKKRLDCLNRKKSIITAVPEEPETIMEIPRHSFFKTKIPKLAVFSIPELKHALYVTEGVKELVESSKLKGLYFIDAEKHTESPFSSKF